MIEITKQRSEAELAKMFKALSNENRLRIYNLIREGVGNCCTIEELGEPCSCVCDVADGVSLALSTVSHHLKELRNAGLIQCRKVGQWVYCTADPEALDRIEDFLEA